MTSVYSPEFGDISYTGRDVYHFPEGLPGFEQTRDFLLYTPAYLSPFLVLIHLSAPAVRFFAIDLTSASPPDYSLTISPEDRLHLQLGPEQQPSRLLGLVTWNEQEAPTVNLLAPILLNGEALLGRQSIQFESGYACRHPLLAESKPCL